MVKTIIASIMPEESRMVLLEDGEIVEAVLERSEDKPMVGNIYKGKVKNVLPGMQAAFIDVGWEKSVFLHTSNLDEAQNNGKLTLGQDIMIQIVKEASGTKGPQATTHITLPGRYVVLTTTSDTVHISRRITDAGERRRLINYAEKIKPQGLGMIIRTVSGDDNEQELAKDTEYLVSQWNTVSARAKIAKAPTLLYRDADLAIRIVRDYWTKSLAEFILDNQESYQRVCDLITPDPANTPSCLKLYKGKEDIFTHYKIDEQLDKLMQRRVDLKCGGYIIFDHTEALTIIDVNSGKFTGRNNSLADTAFQTNLDAANEIARQIRLRDIGGIILVDFIDMAEIQHKQTLLEVLGEQFKKDRTHTKILGITQLGLLEMTRKKGRQNIRNISYINCPYCYGTGRLKSPQSVANAVQRHLRSLSGQQTARNLIIQAHPRTIEILSGPGELAKMEKEFALSLTLEALPTMHDECYSILSQKD